MAIENPGSSRPSPSDTETGIDLARRLAPGTLIGGRYRIRAMVGLGGMGVVYRAHDEELDLDIALKVLRPDLGTNQQWIERFRRELVLARQVTHRNVVRIHDIGESDGLRYLTMRYVEGQSLLEVLDKGGPLPLERALRIVRQIADALQDAHDAGIVHRDLKPGNILLEADDTAYITDFGVPFPRRDGLTRTGKCSHHRSLPPNSPRRPRRGRRRHLCLCILLMNAYPPSPRQGASRAEIPPAHQRRSPTSARRGPVPPMSARYQSLLDRSPARRYHKPDISFGPGPEARGGWPVPAPPRRSRWWGAAAGHDVGGVP